MSTDFFESVPYYCVYQVAVLTTSERQEQSQQNQVATTTEALATVTASSTIAGGTTIAAAVPATETAEVPVTETAEIPATETAAAAAATAKAAAAQPNTTNTAPNLCKCNSVLDRATLAYYVQCKNCEMFWCNVGSCDRSYNTRNAAAMHKVKHHKSYYDDTFTPLVGTSSSIRSYNNLPIPNICRNCGGPKTRLPGLLVMHCSQCKTCWCTFNSDCVFEFHQKTSVQLHQQVCHNEKRIQKCGGFDCKTRKACGEAKVRGQDYRGQCKKCKLLWCLLGDCTFETTQPSQLNAHFSAAHLYN